MTTTLQDILPSIDDARQAVQDLGFRLVRVFIRVRTWTGVTQGQGTASDVDTELLPRPRVREQQEGKDAFMPLDQGYSNAGLHYTGNLKIDRISPQTLLATLSPAAADNQRVYVVLVGADGGEEATALFIPDGAPVRETTQWTLQVKKVEA